MFKNTTKNVFKNNPLSLLFNVGLGVVLVLGSAAVKAESTSAHANLEISAQLLSPKSVRLEPAFWWAGMHNPKLQLMLHGLSLPNNHQHLKVEVSSSDIKVLGSEDTDNPHYLFINLDLSAAKAQQFEITVSDGDTLLYRIPYTLEKRETGSRERQGFSRKDAIYLITPDRFANGNSANDNHPDMLEKVNRANPDGRHGGDIAGIAQHLDYFAKLGVTQLWINPLLENNQQAYSYHGYSITDLYRIDPRFGSNQDYQALAQQAKQQGLGIIMDVVLNHIGSNHWWLKDLPSKDWLNMPDNQTTKPNEGFIYSSHRRTTVQDPYASTVDTEDFTDGWFDKTMPDLNQRNPKLATYLIQNSIWWVEYAGLTGIREDTYSYSDKAFLTQWSKALMDEYPNFNIVGEEWSNNPITVSYWQKGKINADGYQTSLPSLMDFPVYEKLIESLNAAEDWGTGLVQLYEVLTNDVVYPNSANLVLFEGNHDTNRLYSLVKEDFALYQMALTYVFTAKRIPQIFYGTEVLMTSPTKDRHDGVVRSDFPGGFASGSSQNVANAFTGLGLSDKQQQAQAFVTKLLNYRKQSNVLQEGDLLHFVPKDGVYVQFRCLTQGAKTQSACHDPLAEKVMVIYNKNGKESSLELSRFAEVLSGHTAATDALTDAAISLNKPLVLSTKGVSIVEIKAAAMTPPATDKHK
ncbi:glycoside hydrolase family 13 protein [Shewanella acanthi]|nr:glycoside hydrolase family 13 protein [Shewanella acanthi]